MRGGANPTMGTVLQHSCIKSTHCPLKLTQCCTPEVFISIVVKPPSQASFVSCALRRHGKNSITVTAGGGVDKDTRHSNFKPVLSLLSLQEKAVYFLFAFILAEMLTGSETDRRQDRGRRERQESRVHGNKENPIPGGPQAGRSAPEQSCLHGRVRWTWVLNFILDRNS